MIGTMPNVTRYIARPATEDEGSNFVVEDTTTGEVVYRLASHRIDLATQRANDMNAHVAAILRGEVDDEGRAASLNEVPNYGDPDDWPILDLDDWDNAPAPPGDPILHAHKLGYHDAPEDDCPACRVDRGAALLDERRPGWWEDVDVAILDIGTCERCTLGQTFGGFRAGIEALFGGTDPEQTEANGFIWAEGEIDEVDLLTELWRSKISERMAR